MANAIRRVAASIIVTILALVLGGCAVHVQRPGGGDTVVDCTPEMLGGATGGAVLGALLGGDRGAVLGGLLGGATSANRCVQRAVDNKQPQSGQRVAQAPLPQRPTRMDPEKCVAAGLFKLLDTGGSAAACVTQPEFLSTGSHACLWQYLGSGVWRLRGTWNGNGPVREHGQRTSGCYGVSLT